MKSEKNILIAFILNLCFSVFELFGGLFTGSVAIISDSIHDIGDAASIGISYFLERKSKKQPDENYTYGYARYSVIGGAISTLILIFGSITVICNAVARIVTPTPINYNGMIIFAIIGVFVNAAAAFFTQHGVSLNQKAVNLHMLEDVLGWIVVLIGAIMIKFTGYLLIDSIMSIGVAGFILLNSMKNIKEIADIFLEKVPDNINIEKIKKLIASIDDIIDVHHIHIWTLDGQKNYATMHIVTNADNHKIKHKIREKLYGCGIAHIILELEREGEDCLEKHCKVEVSSHNGHHHHH